MDGSLLLQLADKYGVDYTLEQAVLVSTWESFMEELESRVKKFKDIEMDLYDEIPITSDWRHFWDPLIPDEVLDVLDDEEEAYSYLNDFLNIDYQDFFQEIESGDFWDYQNIKPDLKELLKDRFKEVEFGNYNYFTAHIYMPYVSEIMDEELIEILSPYDFHSEVENIEKAQELVNKIHAHKSNEAVEILKDIENQGYKNLEDVIGIPYWKDYFRYDDKVNLLQYIIKHVIDSMERLKMLNEQLQDVFKLSEKTYQALDVAVDCVADFLKGIETTYEDTEYWIDFFEANDMVEEAEELRAMWEKQKKSA